MLNSAYWAAAALFYLTISQLLSILWHQPKFNFAYTGI